MSGHSNKIGDVTSSDVDHIQVTVPPGHVDSVSGQLKLHHSLDEQNTWPSCVVNELNGYTLIPVPGMLSKRVNTPLNRFPAGSAAEAATGTALSVAWYSNANFPDQHWFRLLTQVEAGSRQISSTPWPPTPSAGGKDQKQGIYKTTLPGRKPRVGGRR